MDIYVVAFLQLVIPNLQICKTFYGTVCAASPGPWEMLPNNIVY